MLQRNHALQNNRHGAGGSPSAARNCGMPGAAACRTPRSSPRQLPTSSLNGSRFILLLLLLLVLPPLPLLPWVLLLVPAATGAAAAAAWASAATSSRRTPSVVTAVPARPTACSCGQRASAAAAASVMREPPQLKSTASRVAPNLGAAGWQGGD